MQAADWIAASKLFRTEAIIKTSQRRGYSDSPSARRLFYTAGSRNGLEGGCRRWVRTQKKKLSLRRDICFLIEKNVIEIIWVQNFAPDLLVAIMKASGLAKERLREISSEMNQFRSKIQEFRSCTFQMNRRITDFCRRLPAGAT